MASTKERSVKSPQKAPAPPLPGGTTLSALAIVAALWVGLQLDGLRKLLRLVVVDDPQGVVQLVIYLSGILVGSTFAGAVCGTILLWWLESRPGTWAARQARYVIGAAGGFLVGVIAGGLVFWTFADKVGVAALVGGVIGVTAIVGGLISAMRPQIMVAAGLLGGVALLVVWFIRGYRSVQDGILDLLNAGTTARDQFNAYGWYGLSTSLLAGFVVGLVVHFYLRKRRARLTLLGHVFAGALPGLFALMAELFMWVVGNQLLSFAGQLSVLDETSVGLASEAQFNGALAVLFAGAMTSLLAVGLLTPKDDMIVTKGKGKPARGVPAPRKTTAKKTVAGKGGNTKNGTARSGGPAKKASAEEKATVGEEATVEGKPVAEEPAKPANSANRRGRPAQKGRTTPDRARPKNRP
ncbi:hypothetical protein [Phytomonospora endophytica]|uniref:MFS family permease n=1 Tax=Phytomonospora endophytica TaxID=714109 RepID=A0A841FTK3_9ACTN|nr:hypothetical protein [Phytomonospora endophytica]MBB6039655.1 MFS family permease [Phytomonospora endophytica]